MDSTEALQFQSPAAAHRLGHYSSWHLSGYRGVDLAWHSRTHGSDCVAHRLLPHGEPSIAIRRQWGRDGQLQSLDLTVCGSCSRAAFYEPISGEELVAVRLQPETAALLFDVAPVDYCDAAPALAPKAVYDACSRTLRFAASHSGAELIPILVRDLAAHASREALSASAEAYAAKVLRHSRGSVQVSQIAADYGVSERHLRRCFRDSVGLSPKTYARQLRTTQAALVAERSIAPDWSAIAAAFAFHDQSHLINDFKSLIGITPGQLHRERRALIEVC